MNRRSFFSLIPALGAASAVEAKPATKTYNPSYWREKVEMAMIRLRLINIGESPSPAEYDFCEKFCDPLVTPEELAERLRPYLIGIDAQIKTTEPLAWTPPTNCAQCGRAIMDLGSYNLVRVPLLVLQCSGIGNCENRRPWIQFPDGRTEWVSLRVRELLDDGWRSDAELHTAEWNYRNRVDLGVDAELRTEAMAKLRYMHGQLAATRAELLYRELARWR